jgi:MFS family permease
MLISIALLRISALHPQTRADHAQGSFAEGLRYVLSRPDLKAMLAMLFLIGAFGLNFPIFISTMAVGVFHADARLYGLLSSILAIGTMAGALVSAGVRKPQLGWLLAGAGILGLSCALAASAPSYWLFAGALVVMGLAAMIFTNTTNSLMQLSTERAMRGRAVALGAAITLGGASIGAPIVGWVADRGGPRWALGVGAASGFAAALVAVYALARGIRGPGS